MVVMRFGISTTVLREQSVSYALERIARAGYASAEVWPWHLERTGERPQDLAHWARDLGLALTFHAFTVASNPLAADPGEASRARRMIAAGLAQAEALEARVVTVHPGQRTSEDERLEDAWGRLVAWVAQLDELASRRGLQVGLELMEKLPLEFFMTPADAARLMAMPFRQVGLTVDIAHMNTHGDPRAFLAALDPAWIAHVHLSDNAPHRVHLPLGDGEIDLEAVLAALGQFYAGIVSIEGSVPGQGEDLLARNMAYLRKIGI